MLQYLIALNYKFHYFYLVISDFMQMQVFYRQIASMGTRLEIVIPGLEDSLGFILLRDIENELSMINRQVSNYDPHSDISKFNSLAPGETMEISGYFSEFIHSGLHLNTLTCGYYDFSLGAWTSKPDLIPDNGSRLAAFLNLPLEQRIQVKGKSAGPLVEDLKLDSGGIGKGIAISAIEKLLHQSNIQAAFISFGGSSVLGLGKHPYGDTWKVGISDPEDGRRVISELELMNMSLSVSGNSMNNRKKYGTGGHILNPVNGSFYQGRGLVAVVTKSAVEAEAISTALLLCRQDEEKQLISNFVDVQFYRYENN